MLQNRIKSSRIRVSGLVAVSLGCVVSLALAGCGGGGGTPPPDTLSGQVSTSAGPVGAGYTVLFDNSASYEGVTTATGAYTITVPVSAITGNDTVWVVNPSSTVVGTQPVATALSTAGSVAVTQNVLLVGSPPPVAPLVR